MEPYILLVMSVIALLGLCLLIGVLEGRAQRRALDKLDRGRPAVNRGLQDDVKRHGTAPRRRGETQLRREEELT